MALYKNFKTVVYCIDQWADKITEPELRKQTEWFQKYIGIDKVYLETYRGEFARKEQLQMIKKVLQEYGIEVSGGITTVRHELMGNGKIWIDAEAGVSLFTYDNNTFGLYCYTNDNCKPLEFNLHIKGNENESIKLEVVKDDENAPVWGPKEIEPLYSKPMGWKSKDINNAFHRRINPGDFKFFRIVK